MVLKRKLHFVGELESHYQKLIADTHRAETDAGQSAEQQKSEARKREDARGAVEQGRLATGHRRRRQRGVRELEELIAFTKDQLPRFDARRGVSLGAMVDVSVESEQGSEERTLFLLPVGAGTELVGPGGDGFISVITPASPVGRSLLGTRPGDSFEIVIDGRDFEWTVVDLC